MKFDEQLQAIRNFSKDECMVNHDFLLDAEYIHIENCIGTGYKHQRKSEFSDDEILVLADAVFERYCELIGV